jgi:hypothetical protein
MYWLFQIEKSETGGRRKTTEAYICRKQKNLALDPDPSVRSF